MKSDKVYLKERKNFFFLFSLARLDVVGTVDKIKCSSPTSKRYHVQIVFHPRVKAETVLFVIIRILSVSLLIQRKI